MDIHVKLLVVLCLLSCHQTLASRRRAICTKLSLNLPSNARVDPTRLRYRVGGFVSVTCRSGSLFPISSRVRQCLSNGLWNINGGTCQEQCPDPVDPPHTHREGSCCNEGSVLNYTCSQGWELVGESQVSCRYSREGYLWSAPPPTCQVLETCGDPGEAEGATRRILRSDESVPQFVPGDAVLYTCNDGHFIDYLTEDRIECTEQGTWSAEPPLCFVAAESTCERPSITNGTVTPDKNDYHAGEYVTVSCGAGYILHGHSEIQCMGSDYGWNQIQMPTCVLLTCPSISWPQNGRLTPLSTPFIPGAQIQFVCNSGYTMIGPALRTCEQTGQWSGISVRCDNGETVCPNPGIPDGARKQGNVYNKGSTVTYTCYSGMYLKGSAERVCLANGLWSGQETSCQGPGQTDKPEDVGAMLSLSFDKISLATQSSPLYDHIVDELGGDAATRTIRVGQAGGVDLYFLFDVSGSIAEPDFERSKRFAIELLNKTGVSQSYSGTRFGFITFDTEPVVNVPITHNIDSFSAAKNEIESLRFPTKASGRSTSITAALIEVKDNQIPTIRAVRQARGVLTEPQNVVVIVTDGNYNVEGTPEYAAEELKRNEKAEIYCIGVGEDINDRILRKMASNIPGEEHFFRLRRHEDLDVTIRKMLSKEEGYSDCGVSYAHDLNDEAIEKDARNEAWPWMAKINFRGRSHSCGGTIIGNKWILTAAHCFDPEAYNDDVNARNPNYFTVILGKTKADDQAFSSKTISDIYLHPEYNTSVVPDQLHDIALLKLTNAAYFSPIIRPVCLPDDIPGTETVDWFQPRLGHKGVVTGWGELETNINAKNLRQKQMDLRTREECEDSMENHNKNVDMFDDSSMFCAGNFEVNGVVDACHGDSGGPFVVRHMVNRRKNDNRFFQIGVVSWGYECRTPGLYGFYTKLNDEHLQWIRQTITENP